MGENRRKRGCPEEAREGEIGPCFRVWGGGAKKRLDKRGKAWILARNFMEKRNAIIANEQGIHCRPSAVIVKEFMGYPGRILLRNRNGACDVSSVMQLLSLELRQGSHVTIEVEGENEAKVADRLLELLETHFDFPPV